MPSSAREPSSTSAVVMSGGGARGAYQAGVLAGLADLGLISDNAPLPFRILIGSSAGAINAAGMAAMAERPTDGVARLVKAWSEVEAQQVFRTDLRSLGGIGVSWARDLSFGGLTGKVSPKALLDTSPLRDTLDGWIPFNQISRNIKSGAVDALVLATTNLYTSTGIVFVEGADDRPLWRQRRRRIERTKIGVDHVMASSAIPLLFPPVHLEDRWFGDGSIRNTTPLSPAIHLGADRVLAISVREQGPDTEVSTDRDQRPAPSIAEIAGVLLDAVMLDAIEVDVDHSDRVNDSITRCAQPLPGQPFRWVDVLALHPSENISSLAAELVERLPRVVRYMMRGLGSEAAITELTSYLLFDPVFCGRLVDLGRRDVAANQDEIRSFFTGPPRVPKLPTPPE